MEPAGPAASGGVAAGTGAFTIGFTVENATARALNLMDFINNWTHKNFRGNHTFKWGADIELAWNSVCRAATAPRRSLCLNPR